MINLLKTYYFYFLSNWFSFARLVWRKSTKITPRDRYCYAAESYHNISKKSSREHESETNNIYFKGWRIIHLCYYMARFEFSDGYCNFRTRVRMFLCRRDVKKKNMKWLMVRNTDIWMETYNTRRTAARSLDARVPAAVTLFTTYTFRRTNHPQWSLYTILLLFRNRHSFTLGLPPNEIYCTVRRTQSDRVQSVPFA